MKYKEKFDKEVKGKRPQYDLKESKIYKTLKDANVLASEVGAQHLGISQHRCFELSSSQNRVSEAGVNVSACR